MSPSTPVYVSAAVEGPTDESALRRVIHSRGGLVHRIQVQGGKPAVRRALGGYNAAARYAPWLVLVDLDDEYSCAAELVAHWLPNPSPQMRLRVAVRELESWLLADAERFASWFRVRRSRVPREPDSLPDAKRALLDLVAQSSKSSTRLDMLPRANSGREVGPAYTSSLIEYIEDLEEGWRPEIAAARSPSLAKTLVRLEELMAASHLMGH
jgi:hypothetical protein